MTTEPCRHCEQTLRPGTELEDGCCQSCYAAGRDDDHIAGEHAAAAEARRAQRRTLLGLDLPRQPPVEPAELFRALGLRNPVGR